ncbi:general substrate transporter [Clavulina sp. PMI_390]|nr:general substrate transporter [Clavulina sp. PMI_390]
MSNSNSDIEKLSAHELEHAGPTKLDVVRDVAHLDGAHAAQVKNAAFANATVGATLKPWSREAFVLYAGMFVAFLCSCVNGYDGSLMTSINGMVPFQNRFNGGKSAASTGLIFAMYTVGGMVGPFFGGPITDRFGRRKGMVIGALIICLGSAVIASAKHQHQFVGGRFILGFGVSILTCAAPSYCVEICPPQWRGRMTGFYNCGWFGGSIPAAGICLGTQSMTSDWGWKIPLILQCAPAAVVVFTAMLLPESPRWLMAQGRDEEALAFLTKYHGAGNEQDPIVQLEYMEFKEQIEVGGTDKRFWDYSGLFSTSSQRWRSLMVIFMGVAGQFSGNGLGYFNLQIYEAVGYDSYMQFVLNLANSFTSAFGAGCGVYLADRMPRRQALVWGTFASALMLAINGGLSAKWAHQDPNHENLAVGRGAVAAYFFFNIIYSFAYTPLQALYPVECLQTNSRAKGMSMYGVVVSAISFVNTYAGPIALANIKYNYVFIFVGWDIVESVIWYLICVETVGRTLEELEEIFVAPNPVAASKRDRTVAIHHGGVAVVSDKA